MSNLPQTRQPGGPPAASSPKREFEDLLAASLPKLAEVIPTAMRTTLTPERIARLAMVAFRKNNDLAECKVSSILGSLMTATQLGLEVNTPLGHAYLIPYKKECTLQIGYRGLIELAHRARKDITIDSRLVYSKDVFDIYYDPAPVFVHRPCLEFEKGLVTHAYAYAYVGGAKIPVFEIMDGAEIHEIRQSSPGRNSPAWTGFEGEMQRKTVLKRMLKKLPLSVELAAAIEHDNDGYDVDTVRSVRMIGSPRRGNASVLHQLEQDEAPGYSTSDLPDEDLDDLASTEGGREG